MQIIGDRHYKSDPGEQITFSVGGQTQVGAVTAASNVQAGTTLPMTVSGSGHRTVAVTAGFIGADGGSADIVITGGHGGGDESEIRQLTTLAFPIAIFIIATGSS